MTLTTSPSQYQREDIERILTVIFNGGVPWRDENAPDRDMPKATANPSHGGVFVAEKVDVERAWWAVFDYLANREALYLYYGCGMTQANIGRELGVSQQTISTQLARDIGLLRDAATAGARPRGKAALRYRTIRGVK